MPTTYSTNLRISLMATGENSGVWGVVTNTNLGTLIEQAIVGATTVAMADANQTMVITDGASSDGRNVYITCTGALTADRNLTVPTVNKNYVVFNNTTGGFNVYVKTAAGTGVYIAPGQRVHVYADGTNVVGALNSFTNLYFTTPASPATVTIGSGKTVAISNSLTLTGTDSTSFAFPSTSDTVATIAATQTLTNKTLTDCVANTQTANNNSTKLATTAYADAAATAVAMPSGALIPYAGLTAPTGWLLCYGQAVSRTTYAALFAIISTTYGSGDGSTTFNLPDLRGRLPVGKDNMGGSAASRVTAGGSGIDGTTLGASGGDQLSQQHNHGVTDAGHTHGFQHDPLNGFGGTLVGNLAGGGSNLYTDNATASHTTGVTINNYGSGSSQNMPPALIISYIIKT